MKFLVRISAPECLGVKKFLPIAGAAGNRAFLARMSTFFGADVHDPKGFSKSFVQSCVDFLVPKGGEYSSEAIEVMEGHSCWACWLAWC